MDQHVLSWADFGQMGYGLPGGDEGFHHAGRWDHRKSLRDLDGHAVVNPGQLCIGAAADDRHHLFSYAEASDLGAHRDDFAGELQAQQGLSPKLWSP